MATIVLLLLLVNVTTLLDHTSADVAMDILVMGPLLEADALLVCCKRGGSRIRLRRSVVPCG